MNCFFDLYGPYDIPSDEESWTPSMLKRFLAGDDDLSAAIGCYVFCIRHGKNIKPWYVGMTVNKKGFKEEVFAQHKRAVLKSLCKRRGSVCLFLFPLLTETDRFAKGRSNRSTIMWLEGTLMGMAFSRNPEIVNIRGLNYRKNVDVFGLLGSRKPGRPHSEVKYVRSAFFGEGLGDKK